MKNISKQIFLLKIAQYLKKKPNKPTPVKMTGPVLVGSQHSWSS